MGAAAGDWLQGPYVYALYSYYGYTKGDIGKLFIAGFGSSMVFGTIAGSLADKQYAPLLSSHVALAFSWTKRGGADSSLAQRRGIFMEPFRPQGWHVVRCERDSGLTRRGVVDRIQTHSGRKKAALLYVVTYIASCITKHSPDYYILMLGRFFGGIATSLLFSAFESWLVAEHFKVLPTMLPHRPCLDPILFPLPRGRCAKPNDSLVWRLC
jgi:MFS family permease